MLSWNAETQQTNTCYANVSTPTEHGVALMSVCEDSHVYYTWLLMHYRTLMPRHTHMECWHWHNFFVCWVCFSFTFSYGVKANHLLLINIINIFGQIFLSYFLEELILFAKSDNAFKFCIPNVKGKFNFIYIINVNIIINLAILHKGLYL